MALLEEGNYTAVTEFILSGLTNDPVLKVILFTTILCIYLVTMSGNLSTILLVRVSSQLHHPMYFFLSHLASTDIGYSSSVTPNMLVGFLVNQSTISFIGCFIQFGSAAFLAVECFLLAAMAYDHFVAIWNPLLSSIKMSTQVCIQLVAGSYIGGFFLILPPLSYLIFVFCGPNRVNHFYCDFAPLLELSCSDVSVTAVVTSVSAASVTMITVLATAVSYTYILITILKMRSPEGRHKAFSTCTSHLTAVTLFYGIITFIYVMTKSSYSTDQNKVVSVF
ncbi:Olfactory receptor 484 [Lemmus lemmus]